MKDIVSKFSLYDILAMVIPGGAIIVSITLMIKNLLVINENLIEKPLFWIIWLVVSYIIGLLNHILAVFAWKMFRNNDFMIKLSVEKARSHLSENGHFYELTNTIKISNIDKGRIRNWICLIMSVSLVYIIFASLMLIANCIYKKCNSIDISLMLTIPFIAILLISAVELIYALMSSKGSDPIVLQKYYSAYYFVAKNKYNDDISIMEGQIAFLQNMVFPLVLFCFAPKDFLEELIPGISGVLLLLLLIISILAIIIVVFCRQMKIYQRVWDDYEYLLNTDNNTTNINLVNINLTRNNSTKN